MALPLPEMTQEIFTRQLDAVPQEALASLHVGLIGAGGIGSNTALMLQRMGIETFTLWDKDFVDVHNWPTQLFDLAQIGKSKVNAVEEQMSRARPGVKVLAHPVFFEEALPSEWPDVLISGVDSMEARKSIWAIVRRYADKIKLYIDGRMALSIADVVVVKPGNNESRERYVATLVTDDQALQAPCTARSICYAPAACAGLICNVVARHVSGRELPDRVVFDYATLGVDVWSGGRYVA